MFSFLIWGGWRFHLLPCRATPVASVPKLFLPVPLEPVLHSWCAARTDSYLDTPQHREEGEHCVLFKWNQLTLLMEVFLGTSGGVILRNEGPFCSLSGWIKTLQLTMLQMQILLYIVFSSSEDGLKSLFVKAVTLLIVIILYTGYTVLRNWVLLYISPAYKLIFIALFITSS